MKKIILLAFICFSTALCAQKSFFGLDAGVNVANQRTIVYYPGGRGGGPIPIATYFGVVNKFTFGAFYQYRVFSSISLRANAQYMALGYVSGFNGNTLDINYLTIPVTVHYHASKKLSLSTGAYLSFLIGDPKINGQSSPSIYHQNDHGISFGGEHSVYKMLSLSVNYFVGLKNIWLNDQGGSVRYTNRTLQFSLIYRFMKSEKTKL